MDGIIKDHRSYIFEGGYDMLNPENNSFDISNIFSFNKREITHVGDVLHLKNHNVLDYSETEFSLDYQPYTLSQGNSTYPAGTTFDNIGCVGWVPTTPAPAPAPGLPVICLFHGDGGSSTEMIEQFERRQYSQSDGIPPIYSPAQMYGYIVLAFQGLGPVDYGSNYGSQCNAYASTLKSAIQSNTPTTEYYWDFLESISEKYNIDMSRVYLACHSSGGTIASALLEYDVHFSQYSFAGIAHLNSRLRNKTIVASTEYPETSKFRLLVVMGSQDSTGINTRDPKDSEEATFYENINASDMQPYNGIVYNKQEDVFFLNNYVTEPSLGNGSNATAATAATAAMMERYSVNSGEMLLLYIEGHNHTWAAEDTQLDSTQGVNAYMPHSREITYSEIICKAFSGIY